MLLSRAGVILRDVCMCGQCVYVGCMFGGTVSSESGDRCQMYPAWAQGKALAQERGGGQWDPQVPPTERLERTRQCLFASQSILSPPGTFHISKLLQTGKQGGAAQEHPPFPCSRCEPSAASAAFTGRLLCPRHLLGTGSCKIINRLRLESGDQLLEGGLSQQLWERLKEEATAQARPLPGAPT